MFDAIKTKARITSVINQYGSAVTISHATFDQDTETDTATNVYNGRAVFSSRKVARTSEAGSVTVVDAIAYIGASGKRPPVPGDTLTGKGRTFTIKAVADYQPADVVIAYMLELE